MPNSNTDARLADRLEAIDKTIVAWAKKTKRELLQKLLAFGIKDRLEFAKTVSRLKVRKKQIGGSSLVKDPFLSKSLHDKIFKKDQEIEGTAFSFARHGIFIEQGAGKGRKKGSGAARAAAKPWLSSVLPAAVEQLADILEEEYADIAAAELVMSIPGVFETKMKIEIGGNRAAQNEYMDGILDSFLAALEEDIRQQRTSFIKPTFKI